MSRQSNSGIGSGEHRFTLGGGDTGAIEPDFGNGIVASDGSGSDSPGGSDGGDVTGFGGRKPRSDRGRPRGPRGPNTGRSGSRSKTSSASNIDALTRLLAIVHLGLAAATKAPELELDDSDAKALAAATANVLEQFEIKPDPKIEAIIGLIIVSGSIYGPKLYMMRERMRATSAKNITPQGGVNSQNSSRNQNSNAAYVHAPMGDDGISNIQ